MTRIGDTKPRFHVSRPPFALLFVCALLGAGAMALHERISSVWHGSLRSRGSRAASAGASPARLAAIDSSFRALEDGEREAPRDRWDPDYVVGMVGRDPGRLFDWVRDDTYWIPYHGELRGPVGVLMDRQGNSLDRALLLATLLEKAGYPVRLAHGELTREQALELLPGLVARQAASFVAPGALEEIPAAEVRNAAAPYHLNGDAIARSFAAQHEALVHASSELQARVADQSERLLRAVQPPDARAEWGARLQRAVDALRDHWWVQRKVGGRWLDLDVLDSSIARTDSAAPSTPLAAVTDTLGLEEVAGAPLHHEIVVRVIAEQWSRGTLTEHTTLEHVLRPSELIGESLVVQFWPMNWVVDSVSRSQASDDLRGAALDQQSWVATLFAGREMVATAALIETGTDPEAPPKGGAMGGFGDALSNTLGGGGTGGATQLRNALTAVWLEYEIRVPGETPRRIRRTVFDLIGPAVRATAPPQTLSLDDTQRLTRSLALTMHTEILPVECRLAPEFVRHLVAAGALGNRELIGAAARGELAPGSAAMDSLLGRAASMPGSLHALALARSEWSPEAGVIYIDQPNILTEHVYAAPGREGIALHNATDIVANEVGVSLAAPDAFRVRLAQGVLETNAESLLRFGETVSGNAGDAFAASRDWTALTPQQASAADELKLPGDVRHRIGEELAAGEVAVAPRAPVAVLSDSFAGWWRIDPATGSTLGFGANGWGTADEEDGLIIRTRALLAAPRFRNAMIRFGLAFRGAYMWCLASVTAPQIESQGLRVGVKAGIVSSVHECVGDAFAIGIMSAVAPLVALTVEGSRGRFTPRAPNPPEPPIDPLGKTQVDPYGRTQPYEAKAQPADPLGETRVDPTKTQPDPPAPPKPQPGSPEGPKGDPHGDTQADPSKTQYDPGCAPPAPDEPMPNAPRDLAEARKNYQEAKAAAEAAQKDLFNAASESLQYGVNQPNSRWWDADPTKWDRSVSDALKHEVELKRQAFDVASKKQADAWSKLADAANAANRAKAAAAKGAPPGSPVYYRPPTAPAAPASPAACGNGNVAFPKTLLGVGGLGGNGS